MIEWFIHKEISRKQQIAFIKKAGLLKWQIDPREMADVVRMITENMSTVYREYLQATTEYLKILIDLKSYFPLRQILDPKLLDEQLHRFSSEFERHQTDSPLMMLEYIRLLNELNKYYPFRRKFKGDILEESLHRLTKEFRHYVRGDAYSAFEYLRLLNELRHYSPIRKMHPEFVDETIHIISKDIKHFAKDNPQAILEYLKLLYDLKEHFPIKEKIPQEFITESLSYIVEEWDNVSRDSNFNLLECLKIISGFIRHSQMEDYLPHSLIRDAFYRLSKDLHYIIRENPKEAHDYLQVLKQFQKYFTREQRRMMNKNNDEHYTRWLDARDMDLIDDSKYYHGKRHMKDLMMNEPLLPTTKDMEIDIDLINNYQSWLVYLELLLINREYYRGDREEQMIERMVDSFRNSEIKQEINVALKAAVLLIQYGAPLRLIEHLLDHHPKFRDLFSHSPEIARAILEATVELKQ